MSGCTRRGVERLVGVESETRQPPQVFEETGVKAAFLSIAGLRENLHASFGRSDM